MNNIYMDSTPPPQEKKGCGCMKMMAIGCGAMAAFALLAIVLVYNALSWVGNAPTPTPATYAPLNLSPGENEDIDRIIQGIEAAKRSGKDVEEYVTPAVFNGLFERIINEERRKKGADTKGPEALRLELAEGNAVRLQITLPAEEQNKQSPQKLYVNVDTIFEMEVKDGELTQADIKSLKLNNQEPPWLVRAAMDWFSQEIKKQSRQKLNEKDNGLRAIKLLKREGDRIHVIIDGEKMAEQEAKNLQQNNSSTPKKPVPPEKAPPNKPEDN